MKISGVLHDALECFISAFTAAPAWERIAFWVLTAFAALILLLEFLADAALGGAATFLRIATTISLIGIYVANFVVGLLDNDYVVG